MAKTESSKDTIQLKLYFWTNNLPLDQIKKDHSGWDAKKTAWNSGVIGLVADKRRGIRAAQVPFSGPDDFRKKLNSLLDKNGVNLIAMEKVQRTGL